MKIQRLFIYPVKSLRPLEVTAAEITNEGLRFDRQYVLVKPPTSDTHGLAEHITIKSYFELGLFHTAVDKSWSKLTITHTQAESKRSIVIPLINRRRTKLGCLASTPPPMAEESSTGTTTTERACDRCRERRVKCDKRHPSCARCEKLGKPCPGYDKKRKFVDEGATLRRKYELPTNLKEPGGGELADLTLNSPRSTVAGASTDSPNPSSIRRKRNPSEQSTPSFGIFQTGQFKHESEPQIFKPVPVTR